MPPFLDFDVVIRNALIATASDTYFADIGIVEGKVQQIGTALAPGRRDIDAAGRVVTPGGGTGRCRAACRGREALDLVLARGRWPPGSSG